MPNRLLALAPLFLFITVLSAQKSKRDILFQESYIYIMQEDYLRAIEKLTLCNELYPSDKKVLNNLAMANYFMGDYESFCLLNAQASALGMRRNKFLYRLYCDKQYRLKMSVDEAYKGVKLLPENAYRPEYTRADSLRGALNPARTCYDVNYYDLTVRIFPRKKSIEGTNIIYFRGVEEHGRIQLDLFDNYEVRQISMEGEALDYERESNAIFINLPEAISIGEYYTIKIDYAGRPDIAPNPPWSGGFVWDRDKKRNHWVGVACEHFGASSWWPNKDHLSDRPDSMMIRIEAPIPYDAVCNGQLQGVDLVDDNYQRFSWFIKYPINNYNVTFYMGKYTSFSDTIISEDDTLYAWYHVMPYNLSKAREHFKQARQIIPFYEKAFGPFPFPEDKFRMCESPYEGMEHQTAIAYGHSYSNEQNAVGYYMKDYDYLIVHEAAHEWWGNSLGTADMADVWLHEGFATYAEFLFIENQYGYDAYQNEIAHKFPYINNIWPLVGNRNVNENTFAGQDVYLKGATLLHCLRNELNHDSLFMRLLYDFQMAYRDTTIQTSDFIDFVHQYTGSNFQAMFDIFLYRTDIPMLSYNYKRQDDDLQLRFYWSNTDPGFSMPFSIKTFGNDSVIRLNGNHEIQEIVLKNTKSFSFINGIRKPDACPHNGLSYYQTHYQRNL